MNTLQTIWHILSTPGTQLLAEQKHSFLASVTNNIDQIALAIAIISILLGIFGSKIAMKGAYWTIVLYFFSKIALNILEV